MFISTKSIVLGGVSAILLSGFAFADPKAPTVWTPPSEISGKPAAPADPATPAAATAPAAAAAPADKAAKEQACAAEAKAKGLKKGKKWAFIDACMAK